MHVRKAAYDIRVVRKASLVISNRVCNSLGHAWNAGQYHRAEGDKEIAYQKVVWLRQRRGLGGVRSKLINRRTMDIKKLTSICGSNQRVNQVQLA